MFVCSLRARLVRGSQSVAFPVAPQFPHSHPLPLGWLRSALPSSPPPSPLPPPPFSDRLFCRFLIASANPIVPDGFWCHSWLRLDSLLRTRQVRSHPRHFVPIGLTEPHFFCSLFPKRKIVIIFYLRSKAMFFHLFRVVRNFKTGIRTFIAKGTSKGVYRIAHVIELL